MRRRRFLFLSASFSAAVLSGCATDAKSRPNATAEAAPPTARPLSPEAARQFATLAPNVREAYTFAFDRPDVLQWVPCYCGCAGQGHTSNLDCFVKPGSGEIVLDAHGAT